MPYQMYVWNINPYSKLAEYIVVFTDGEEEAKRKLRDFINEKLSPETLISDKPYKVFNNTSIDEMTQWTCKNVPNIIKTLW